MSDLGISEADWKADIDSMRNSKGMWNEELDNIILYGRDNEPAVSYARLTKYIKEKFGVEVCKSSVRDRHLLLKERK